MKLVHKPKKIPKGPQIVKNYKEQCLAKSAKKLRTIKPQHKFTGPFSLTRP